MTAKKSIGDALTVAANQKPDAPGKPPELVNQDVDFLVQSGRTDSVFDALQTEKPESDKTSEQLPKPEYLTREQFQSELDSAVKKIIDDSLGRYSQSFADKFANRIQSRIEAAQKNTQKIIEIQRAGGSAISPEQEKALLQQVALDELTNFKSTEPNSEPPAKPDAIQDEVDPIITSSYSLLQGIGVSDITDDEPEYKQLDFAALKRGDQTAWFKSLMAAGTAKKARESKPARTLPGGGGTPPGNQADEIAAKLERLRREPLANKEEIEKLLKELV